MLRGVGRGTIAGRRLPTETMLESAGSGQLTTFRMTPTGLPASFPTGATILFCFILNPTPDPASPAELE